MKIGWLFLLPTVALLAGCARVTTSTALKPDGSFSRKVVYTVSKGNGMGGPEEKKTDPDSLFKLPASGGEVKVVRTEDKANMIVTVTREVAAGGPPLQDITLWAEKGKVMATSSVTVTKLPDGKIEYVETLHSAQATNKSQKFMTAAAELRLKVKKALPVESQKTEIIDKLTQTIMVNLAHALLGPPEPNLLNLALNVDAAARRINSLAYLANVQSFKEVVPGVTDLEASAMAKSLTNLLNTEAMDQSNAAPSEPGSNGEGEMTPLTFAVSFSGKVVETNGLLDQMTGEVYWSLLPMSLEVGDVKLRLVVQP